MRALLQAAACASLVGAQVPQVPIWPQPQAGSYGSSSVGLDSSFTLSCDSSCLCPEPLPAALARYRALIFVNGPAESSPSPILSGFQLCVRGDAVLALGVNESYELSVPAAGGLAQAQAETQWGALRALESFAQLVQWVPGPSGPAAGGDSYIISAPVTIADSPRYPWRGMLVDTSRHFLPVETLLAIIDGMAWNKLNLLHWHAVDDQSWPLASVAMPLLTRAAYAPWAIYSHDDVALVVRHAWERGVRVMLEIDMPAHATAFGGGYPQLTLSCAGGETLLNPVPNASRGDAYDAVDALLAEFLPLFGTDVIHFGGDEVSSLSCWQKSPEVAAFMAAQGYTNVTQVRNYFQTKIQALASERNITVTFWEEVFDQGYDLLPQTIIDAWLSYTTAKAALAAGHRVVVSYGLYLNQQNPPGKINYAWQDTWENFYLADLTVNQTLTPDEESRILGECISQWGIQYDQQNILPNMWPRAAAPAERMWSDKSLRNVTLAAPRIEKWRCTMAQRGMPSGPTTSSWCPLPRSAVGFGTVRPRVDVD